jgi:hypothetical protein
VFPPYSRLWPIIGLLNAGCRPDAPPAVPAEPTPIEDLIGPVATAPAPPPSPGAGPHEAPTASAYELAWTADSDGWNQAIAVSAAGWVVSVGGGMVSVHASDDGRVLESARICHGVQDGFALVDQREGILVCSEEIVEVSFPGLSSKRAVALNFRAKVAGFGGDHVAVADREGRVEVYRMTDHVRVDAFEIGASVEGLAVSPDASVVAVGGDDDQLYVRRGKKTEKLSASDGSRPTALSFSPDGKRIFAHNASFEARIHDVSDGAVIGGHSTGSWLRASTWIDDRLIAATGSDGFVIYQVGNQKPRPLLYGPQHPTAEGIGASPDGTIGCAGDRDGRIACHSARPMPNSSYRPAASAKDGPGHSGGAPTAATPSAESKGHIVAHKGDRLTLSHEGGSLPADGSTGTLSRRFQRQLGKMRVSGWMSIAEVEVISAKGNNILLRILRENADVRLKGQKQDQFRKGFETKLEFGLP